MLRGHPGLIKSQEYTVSVFKIWWLLINLCHHTIIFYLISPWNVKIVSALLLAVSHSLVCNLVQKKTKREGERERILFDNLQCGFEATGAANWNYFHISLGARWLKHHALEIPLTHDLMTNISWEGEWGSEAKAKGRAVLYTHTTTKSHHVLNLKDSHKVFGSGDRVFTSQIILQGSETALHGKLRDTTVQVARRSVKGGKLELPSPTRPCQQSCTSKEVSYILLYIKIANGLGDQLNVPE